MLLVDLAFIINFPKSLTLFFLTKLADYLYLLINSRINLLISL